MVRRECDTQEDYGMVDEESVRTRDSPVEVCAEKVLDVDFLEDVEVREREDAVDADDVCAVHVREPPNLVHVLLAERHHERGVRYKVKREHDTRPHLTDHVNQESEAEDGREAKSRNKDVRDVAERGWKSTPPVADNGPKLCEVEAERKGLRVSRCLKEDAACLDLVLEGWRLRGRRQQSHECRRRWPSMVRVGRGTTRGARTRAVRRLWAQPRLLERLCDVRSPASRALRLVVTQRRRASSTHS